MLTGLESLANARALIVDDNPINRQVLYAQLQPLMPMPGMAASLSEATSMTRERVFDLLLIDLHLPDGMGTDLVQQIRQQGHPSRQALAVAVTADPSLADAHALSTAGYQGVLIKPISPDQLFQCLRHVLNRDSFYQTDPARFRGQQVLNDQAGLRSTDQDGALLATLRAQMAEDLKQGLPKLEQDIQTMDIVTAQTWLHRIAGGAAYCGADQLRTSGLGLHSALDSPEQTQNLAAAYLDFLQAARRTLDAVQLWKRTESGLSG